MLILAKVLDIREYRAILKQNRHIEIIDMYFFDSEFRAYAFMRQIPVSLISALIESV